MENGNKKEVKKSKISIQKKVRDHKIRIIAFFILSMSLLVLLAYNIFKIQVLNYDDYKDYAKGDHEKIESDEPYRGEIKDRNGDLLVSKEISFKASIIPFYYNRDVSDNKEEKLNEIARILAKQRFGSDPTDEEVQSEFAQIKRKLKKASDQIRRNKVNKYNPFPIMDNISEQVAVELFEKADRYPWLTVTISPEREYKLDEAYAHIIGYTSPIFESEKNTLLENEKLYIHSSIIGRSGVEKEYDIQLRGEIGKKAKLRNSKGRFLGEERQIIPTKHGEDLYLTIDDKLQKSAYLAMGEYHGSIVITKPSTGEVLAMVSSPSYDPNTYYMNYRELLNDSSSPLVNRAISGIYPIGSIFKLVVSSAALEYDIVNPKKKYECKGYEIIGYDKRVFKCTHVHGKLDLKGAIQQSCNAYFYNLSQKVGWEKIYEYGKKFGLGELTDIDLENEVAGYFVNEEWKKKNTSMPVWLPGDTANGAIGQGFTAVTPIQIHNIISLIVNDGYLYKPHLLMKRVDIATDEITYRADHDMFLKNDEPVISKDTAEFLKKALRSVVADEGGTAWRARTSKVAAIAGKTSTVQVPDGSEDHALFTCYAPYDASNKDDVIAITVVIENGGYGGVVAAPIATAIIRNYFEGISLERAFDDMGIPYVPPEAEFQRRLSEMYMVSDDDYEGSEILLSSIQSLSTSEDIETAVNRDRLNKIDRTDLTTNTTKDNKPEETRIVVNNTKKEESNKVITNKKEEKKFEITNTKKDDTKIKYEVKDKDDRAVTNKNDSNKKNEADETKVKEPKEIEVAKVDKKTSEEIQREKETREKLKKEREKLLEKEAQEKKDKEKEVEKAIEKIGNEVKEEEFDDDIYNLVPVDPLADIKSAIDEEKKEILENIEEEDSGKEDSEDDDKNEGEEDDEE